MSFSAKKKEQIKEYILDRLSREGDERLAAKTAETFDTSLNTVYRYLREMEADGMIARSGHSIEAVKEEKRWTLERDSGDLDSDTVFYNREICPLIASLPKNVRAVWDYCFSEMMNNAIDHSESERVDVVFRKSAFDTEMIIRDYGKGIFENIKEHFGYPSYQDASAELFKGKLTTDSSRHSGEGIFFTSRALDAFAALANGITFSHNKFEEIEEKTGEDPEIRTYDGRGTLIYMELSNSSQKVMKDIFDRYADIDGGFTRTSIPVGNIFSYPVSRSQASRLLNRFDQFEKVTLDFSGVEEIGQGFADQIFRIYASQHPETKIEVCNTNEAVSRMIYHVSGKRPAQYGET